MANTAAAKTRHAAPHHTASPAALSVVYGGNHGHHLKSARLRYAGYYGARLQCVTYARSATGIDLKGNAANWWDAAAGVYDRGTQPEPGSVLNFRSTGHMRLGHVAVVTAVRSDREIEIAHANWAGPGSARGGVARNVTVVDVSAANDWSAVRVSLGEPGAFGSVYPTYGFIYDRPDRSTGTMVARGGGGAVVDELAEAGAPRRGANRPIEIDPTDAPARTLR